MPRVIDLAALDFHSFVKPGDLVAWGQAAAEPLPLTQRLMAQRTMIGSFRAFIGISLSDTTDPAFADSVQFQSFCGTGTNRKLAAANALDIFPVHYSRLAEHLQTRVDVLLLQVAEHPSGGRYSLSAACDYIAPLAASARLVVAEVNAQAPFTDAEIAPGELDIIVRTNRPLLEMLHSEPTDIDRRIAAHVAGLIEDGATLQFGLGAIPECVALAVSDHRDLGLHTGVMSDSTMHLMERGIITNARKPIDTGASVTGTLLGTRRLADFAHLNPAIVMRPVAYTHALDVLAKLPRFTAINSAVEVDLTGQANSESAGGRYVGSIGGAVDFARGAHASQGGIPIVALPSIARAGEEAKSRIVAQLSGSATLGRADAGVIVTEHGVADLRGLSLSERAQRLIAIADPAFREALERTLRI